MNPQLKPSNTVTTVPETQPEKDCALIQLKDVYKIYKTDAGDFTALNGINLCFGEGEYVSVMGKSGSGKSTLINMITGIDHPTSGSVQVGGTNVHGMREGELAVWRGRTLGVVFQFFQLLPMLSVLENTMLPMDFCNLYAPEERLQRAMALLEMLGLADVADTLPAMLSGGQQQIAAIARALANDPPIIVADEPTGNLDSRTAEWVLDIFAELAARGKTIIIVTHDPALARRTSRQVLISDGELINENVARAFPMLPHSQMLKATRQSVTCNFEAGATITQVDEDQAGLYLVLDGQVEVLRDEAGKQNVVDMLKPGQFFGGQAVIEEQPCQLSFRASLQGSVQVLWLSSEALKSLMADAQAAGSALRKAIWEHSVACCHKLVNRMKETNYVATALV